MTKTVIHRLAARGGLQKGVNPIDPPSPIVKMPNFTAQFFFSLVQKVILASFALRDNCEGGAFFLLLICLNYIKP